MGAGPLLWGDKESCPFLEFLASNKSSGWGDFRKPHETSAVQEEAGMGVSLEVGAPFSLIFLPSAARSQLIPSPPTYNLAYDYISWESFSNVSYYTRALPSVPQDCPTPLGTKGNGDGVRELCLGIPGDA